MDLLQNTHPSSQKPHPEIASPSFYYIFSLFSGILETGAVVSGYCQFGFFGGIGLALAYQLGCLIRNPFHLSLQGALYILGGSVLALLFLGIDHLGWAIGCVALLSGAIQSSREWLLAELPPVSLVRKRFVRVLGFSVGIFAGWACPLETLLLSLAICALFLLCFGGFHFPQVPWINWHHGVRSDRFGIVMLFHQIHYFAYAYYLLLLFVSSGNQDAVPTWMSTLIATGWFAAGWVSYISGEALLSNILCLPSWKACIVGHVWVSLCLLMMANSVHHPFLLGMFWVLGGFGGGSVYAIKDTAKAYRCKADMELWEHLGHVAGVLVTLIALYIDPLAFSMPFILALASAVMTIVLFSRAIAQNPCDMKIDTRKTPKSIRHGS
jgi:hypothetical protein